MQLLYAQSASAESTFPRDTQITRAEHSKADEGPGECPADIGVAALAELAGIAAGGAAGGDPPLATPLPGVAVERGLSDVGDVLGADVDPGLELVNAHLARRELGVTLVRGGFCDNEALGAVHVVGPEPALVLARPVAEALGRACRGRGGLWSFSHWPENGIRRVRGIQEERIKPLNLDHARSQNLKNSKFSKPICSLLHVC